MEKQTYTIYALVDPRDKTRRYVGISKEAHARLFQHMGEIQNDKRAWLTELNQLGLSPEIEILETVEATQHTDANALEREKYWIHRFLQKGALLTNIINTSTPEEDSIKPSYDTTAPSIAFKKALEDAGMTITQLSIKAAIPSSKIKKIVDGEPVSISVAHRVYTILRYRLRYPITYQSLGIKIR